MPIRTQKNPRQHNLRMPRVHESLSLPHRILNRLAPEPRPQLRDDAVRTVRIASILNLEKRALVAGLT